MSQLNQVYVGLRLGVLVTLVENQAPLLCDLGQVVLSKPQFSHLENGSIKSIMGFCFLFVFLLGLNENNKGQAVTVLGL